MKTVSQSKLKWLAGLVLVLFVVASCDSDDPDPVDEPELITTLTVTFTNTSNANDVAVARFRDVDGPGGNDPVLEQPTLSANATYTVTVEILNESITPSEDVTEEVREEDDEHQMFFIADAGLNFTYTYGDEDGDGNPLGLTGTGTTGAAGAGSLNVVLVHEPTKSASGVSNGGITNAGGEEDVRVSFTVTIQ